MRIPFVLFGLIGLAIAVGCPKTHPDPAPKLPDEGSSIGALSRPIVEQPPVSMNAADVAIFETNVSEELILHLTPGFQVLADHFKGEEAELGSLFKTTIEYQGIADFDLLAAINQQTTNQNHLAIHVHWPVGSETNSVSPDKIWEPLIKAYQFEDTQFGVTAGKSLDDGEHFEMKTIFEGRFRDKQNRIFGVKAKQTLTWTGTDDGEWKICGWHQNEMDIIAAPREIFEDVTTAVIPDVMTRSELNRSLHEESIIKSFQNSTKTKFANDEEIDERHPDWESSHQYPSISVVDFDNDGWEDLLVTDRRGPAKLLRNNGKGNLLDVTASVGLKVDGLANCALFFDCDNDGDSDVFIGRSTKPSLFFYNVDGKFELQDENDKDFEYVKYVVSGSVIDVNRDGLLDLYLSTYCAVSSNAAQWANESLRPKDRIAGRMKVEKQHSYLDRGGPPNILLMNRGGRMEFVETGNELKQWRNSYQSIWNDIDDDGDLDLYVCNDFAPDVFLRNDMERGSFDPKFSEISDEIFPDGSMGFGMGASFGDYNSDGLLDLYVSNMYSKAGLRVLEKMGGDVDPRISVSAKGNFLYKNLGGKFEQVAGLQDKSQHVSKVGWSFGGQFCDFNNDTNLDLYVPSGFYSAPKSVASAVDL